MGWRLAVSTLGMPESSLAEVVAVATEAGVGGLELRAGPDQPVHTGLSAQDRAAIRQRLAAAGLDILAVASYVKICAPGGDRPVVDDAVDHLRLAADLGAAGVRVFPGGTGDPDADDDRGARRLDLIAGAAADAGVPLLVETHDSHPRGADVRRLIGTTAARGWVRSIWDVVHTWWAGEPPSATLEALGSALTYVQVKDAMPPLANPRPALPGHGQVGLDDVAEILLAHGYDGWLSLEWEKAWYPDIPDVTVALAATRDWLARWD